MHVPAEDRHMKMISIFFSERLSRPIVSFWPALRSQVLRRRTNRTTVLLYSIFVTLQKSKLEDKSCEANIVSCMCRTLSVLHNSGRALRVINYNCITLTHSSLFGLLSDLKVDNYWWTIFPLCLWLTGGNQM